MGGSSPKKAKKETNSERTARITESKKNAKTAGQLNLEDERARRARRASPLFGGPESGRPPGRALGRGVGGLGARAS